MKTTDLVNALGAKENAAEGTAAIIGESLKRDLLSFGEGRNLLDHSVKNKREDKKRMMQYPERMAQGPRLLADLISITRKIRKGP